MVISHYFEEISYMWRELLHLKVVGIFYRQSILSETQCHNPGQDTPFMSAAEHVQDNMNQSA
jgi:hypothetical protein